MTSPHQTELAALIARHATEDGRTFTELPGLSAVRMSAPLDCTPVVYEPSLCIVGQGHKRARLDGHSVVYDPMHYLICSITLPVESEIEHATPEQPFLGLVLDLDMAVISQLLLEVEELLPWPVDECDEPSITVGTMDAGFSRAVLRLLEVADDPVRRKVLAPGLKREVFFEALRGSQGHRLRQCVLRDSSAHRIARVVRYLEEHFRERLDVETIAREAGMSASALHQHFKQATTMSPMQFVKKLRLHHARSRLLTGESAGQAAFEVGYSSPSQFSREFRRMFGVSPTQVT